jgi:hypothetical protein
MKHVNAGGNYHKSPERLLCQKEKIKSKDGACLLSYKYGKKEKGMLDNYGYQTDD